MNKSLRILLALITIGLGLFYWQNRWPVHTASASDLWYDSNWNYRKAITIDNSGRSSTLTDFQVQLNLNSSNFDFSKAKVDGSDFRVTNSTGELLKYEIETWDQLGEKAIIWLKIPSITANQSTEYFYIYYGNSLANDAQDKTNVWDSNYRGVYHLSETSSLSTGYTLPIEPISLQGDNDNLYVGSQDGSGLRIISRSNFSVTKSLKTSENVERLYVRGRYLAFTGGVNKAYVYDLNTDTFVSTITSTTLLRSAYIDSNNRAYFGEQNTGVIYYTDIGTTNQSTFTVGTDDIRDISVQGNDIIVASNDYKVYVLDKSTFALNHTFTDSGNSVEVADADDNFLWFGSDYQKVWIKNRSSPYTTVAVLHGPTNDITEVDHDDGYWFVSSDDGKIYIYSDTTYQLTTIIDGGNGSGTEQFWLDKTSHILFYIRGHNNNGQHEKKLYSYTYHNPANNYTDRLDSTIFSNDLFASESATTVDAKIGKGISFGGVQTYVAQKTVFNSGQPGAYFSTSDNQAFYYPFGSNFSSWFGDGINNPYLVRYLSGTNVEGGYIGNSGSGETVISRVNNRDFESGFTSGLATGWTKEYASHTYSDETLNPHSGSHAQKVTASANNQHLGVRQNVSLGVGKLFRFSAWIYTSSGDQITFNVGSRVNNFTPPANTWTQVNGYVTAAADTKFRIYISATNVLVGDYIIIDDVVVDEITDIPTNQGAKFYSTISGSTNQLAIKSPTMDPNLISQASVYKSGPQLQGNITFETWVYPLSNVGDQYIGGTWFNNLGYLLYRSGQKFYAKINSTLIDSGATDLPANNWYYVVFVSDGLTEKIYVNGNLYVSESNGTTLPVMADRFGLGINQIDNSMAYSGQIDEVRLARSARTSDWISAQYSSMQNTLLSFGSEISYESTIPTATPTPVPSSFPTPSVMTTSTPAQQPTSLPGNNPSVCTDPLPVTAPDLFQINVTSGSAILYFTPIINTDHYFITYSTSSTNFDKNILVQLGRDGVQQYTINSLDSDTTYYFKIRGKLGCADGRWSNLFTATTLSTSSNKRLVNVYKNTPHKISSNLRSPTKFYQPTPTLTSLPTQKPSLTPTLSPKPTSVKSSPKRCFLWFCYF